VTIKNWFLPHIVASTPVTILKLATAKELNASPLLVKIIARNANKPTSIFATSARRANLIIFKQKTRLKENVNIFAM